MNTVTPISEASAELARILDAYLAARQAGENPSEQKLLAEHPQFADELADCLASLEFIGTVVSPAVMGDAADAGAGSVALPAEPIGDFRLVREIGRGGMGVVYEAVQLSLARRVALKVLPFAAVLDPKQVKRFQNEAQAAASLDHPHIVSVYSVGCERGIHYYAMQYVEGQSLAEVAEQLKAGSRAGDCPDFAESAQQNGTVPLSQADTAPIAALSTLGTTSPRERFRQVARLGIQAAEALHYAHEMGIVHRDVKPSNLLVDAQGHLWITDFGLATTHSDTGLTMTGDLLGTLRYMSPEQAAGDRAKTDFRTDIYSLGITLYELLTGQPAFADTDRPTLLRRIIEGEPKPPRSLDAAIPRDLETIVLKAIKKEPTDRYSSIGEFAEDLHCFLESRPIHARRDSVVIRTSRWLRRHQYVSSIAAAFILLFTMILVVAWHREARLREASEVERDIAQKNSQLAWDVTFSALAPLSEQLNYLPYGRVLQKEALDRAIESYRPLVNDGNVADQEMLLSFVKLLLLRSENSYQLGMDMGSDCDGALAILERLTFEDRENVTIRQLLADAYGLRGQNLTTQLRYSDAAKAIAKGLSVHVPDDELSGTLRSDMRLPYVLLKSGAPFEAEDYFAGTLPNLYAAERVHGFNISSIIARLRLIETLIDLGKLGDAQVVFQDATTIADGLSLDDPTTKYFVEYWSAMLRLGGAVVSSQLGDHRNGELLAKSAINTFENLHSLAPELNWLYTDLGAGYRHLSDALVLQNKLEHADIALGKAIRNFSAADSVVGDFHAGVAQFRRAQLLHALGRKKEAAGATVAALNQYEVTSRSLPDEANCNHHLVILLTLSPLPEFRNPDRALTLAERTSGASGGLYWRCRALAHYQAGDYRAAIKLTHEAMSRLQGGDSIDSLVLAMALWHRGEQTEARRRLERGIEGIERRDHALFGDMGPLAIDQLREEAETLIRDGE